MWTSQGHDSKLKTEMQLYAFFFDKRQVERYPEFEVYTPFTSESQQCFRLQRHNTDHTVSVILGEDVPINNLT